MRFTVHGKQFFRSAVGISNLLAGRENLLLAMLIRRHRDTSGQHRHLRAMRLPAHFELRAEHPRLALLRRHHKRIASVSDAEESSASDQFHAALAMTEIHSNRAVGIQRHLRLIGQCHRANFPRCRDVISAQIVEPALRLPPCAEADHQQQTCGDRQRSGPTQQRRTTRAIHRLQITLQRERLFIGQRARRGFAEFPDHLRLRIRLGMGRVGAQPLAEGQLIASARAVVQQAQPGQRGLLLGRRRCDRIGWLHGAFPGRRGAGSRRLALQASRARIICFSTALWDRPMALAISAYLRP